VAVVGTGSTACQLVPALAAIVEHLTVYQREPGYVLPKRAVEIPPEETLSWWSRRPAVRKYRRLRAFHEAELLNDTISVGSRRHQRTEAASKRYIEKTIADPAVRAAVTPRYAFGCKRPVFASTFYPALNRPNVTLVPRAVVSVTATGVVDATGVERPADVIITATGFKVTDYLSSVEVRGPNGKELHELWGDEPRAFLGITVPGFPNFFMVYGPNTNGGLSIIAQLERQAEVIAKAVRGLKRGRFDGIDTRRTVADRYDRWVQRGIAKKLTALTTGCHNYYLSRTGRNVTQWPHTHLTYLLSTRLLQKVGFRRIDFAAAVARPGGPPEPESAAGPSAVLASSEAALPAAERMWPRLVEQPDATPAAEATQSAPLGE
jgi:cation diffusion facilitator CzcD-associated flavoprotein CzcO